MYNLCMIIKRLHNKRESEELIKPGNSKERVKTMSITIF